MSTTLEMVRGQLIQFQSGQIDTLTMWDRIEQNLERALKGEDVIDPYEDDKAERRIMPPRNDITEA